MREAKERNSQYDLPPARCQAPDQRGQEGEREAPGGHLVLAQQFEAEGDYTSRLALMEDAKLLPAGAVWDYYCQQMNVPVGNAWLAEVKRYERDVLSKRQ